MRLCHIQDWFDEWLPESLFSAGRGRRSVDSWYITALDIEECPRPHLFVADVVKLDRNIQDCVLSRLATSTMNFLLMLGCDSNLRLVLADP